MKKMQLLLVAIVVGGLGYVGYRWWQVQQLASQYDEAAEIAQSSITKDGSTWTIHMESVITEPLDEVWEALSTPERSSELMPETFHKSEIKKEEGSTKSMEFRIELLSLPAQTMMADLTYDDQAKRMTIETSGGIQKIEGTYQLESLAPEKTLLVYDATAVDQVSLPIPQSAMEGALRQFFVMQVRTIKKATGAAPTEPEKKVAEEKAPATGSICTGEVGAQSIKQVTITIDVAEGAAAPSGPEPGTQNDTEKGYVRGYAAGDVEIVENFELDTRCTTADARVGPFLVRVQSVILAPSSLEKWVQGIDFAKLAGLDADAGQMKLEATLPDPARGWNVVSPIDPPPLEDPRVHRAYQQALF